MGKTIAEFISENRTVVSALAKAGQIPATVVAEHRIYESYVSKSGSGKMDKYQAVADENKTSVSTVRNAVRNMQKPI